MLAYAAGELGDPSMPLNTVDRLIAIGSDGMMHAVAESAARSPAAVSETWASRDRQYQFSDAMHDEGDLRAVSSNAQRSGHRAETLFSRASIRTRTSITWISATCERGFRRTAFRKSSLACGLIVRCSDSGSAKISSASRATDYAGERCSSFISKST